MLMELKFDGKFVGKLTCVFKNDMRNLANFHRLKNSHFQLNQNKNPKQPDQPDVV